MIKLANIDKDNKEYYTEYEYDANGNRTAVIGANGKNKTTYVYDKYNRVTKMTDPMGFDETYTYDIAGNMLSKKDRNGNTISYAYDAANRLTKEYSGNTVRAEYTYDMAGNKIMESNGNVTVESIYSNVNTLTKNIINFPGNTGGSYEIIYGYDARKNITEKYLCRNENSYLQMRFISNYQYAYDANNNMISVKDVCNGNNTICAKYTYDNNGNLKTETFDNSVQNTYSYNMANLVSGKVVKKGDMVLSDYTYNYYLDGSLKTNKFNIYAKATKTLDYTYDNLGRLKTETATRGNKTDSYSYSYDDAGNRSSLTVSGTENYTTSYVYDKNNRLLKESKAFADRTDVTRYLYDNNGNTLVKKGGSQNNNFTYKGGKFGIYLDTEAMPYTYEKNTYNVFNQLTSTSKDGKTAVYNYYPNNLRLSKQVSNGSTSAYTGYMWDGSQTVAEIDKDFNLTNIYTFGVGQQRIMGTNLNTNKKTYYMYNPHGDVQGLINWAGDLTKNYEYDAFGNEINPDSSDTNPWRYCGEYYDTETDNIYLRNRYYSPAMVGLYYQCEEIESLSRFYT